MTGETAFGALDTQVPPSDLPHKPFPLRDLTRLVELNVVATAFVKKVSFWIVNLMRKE